MYTGYTNMGHAWAVNGYCMERMLEYIARKHDDKILYPAVVIGLVRLRRICSMWKSGVDNQTRKLQRFHMNTTLPDHLNILIEGNDICGHMSYTPDLIMNRINNEPN